jgi:subtilase family serine protease
MRTFVTACLIFVLLPNVATLHAQPGHSGQAAPDVLSRVTKVKGLTLAGTQAPPDSFCRANFGIPCYSPQQIQTAYGLASLLNAGYTGAGETIIIVVSFGSPTILQDLQTFDADYGLPDPPSFTVLTPLGTVPFDPSNSDQVGWAFETTLDIEWAHAMAPGANIVLLTSPVSETEGVQGMPEFLLLEQYALDHHLGKIISQSWGATENTLFTAAGRQVFEDFERFYQDAAQQNVTVLASTGDSGSANAEINGTTYPFPTVIFPASSPLVTAVGGTSLYADTSGKYQSETIWNNGFGAGGGGVSQRFSEPLYQKLLLNSAQKSLRNHRGIPDVAYNADPNTAILVYAGFLPGAAAYYFIGGTSEGSPQWAGIIADANQLAGHPLGFLNLKLYLLAALVGQSQFFHDITIGSNSFNGVPGYGATIGWDLASGWGTPNLGKLVGELARQ